MLEKLLENSNASSLVIMKKKKIWPKSLFCDIFKSINYVLFYKRDNMNVFNGETENKGKMRHS